MDTLTNQQKIMIAAVVGIIVYWMYTKRNNGNVFEFYTPDNEPMWNDEMANFPEPEKQDDHKWLDGTGQEQEQKDEEKALVAELPGAMAVPHYASVPWAQ